MPEISNWMVFGNGKHLQTPLKKPTFRCFLPWIMLIGKITPQTKGGLPVHLVLKLNFEHSGGM